jgi:hypothetical protein
MFNTCARIWSRKLGAVSENRSLPNFASDCRCGKYGKLPKEMHTKMIDWRTIGVLAQGSCSSMVLSPIGQQ